MEIKYKEPDSQGSEVMYVALFCGNTVMCLLTGEEAGLKSTNEEPTSNKSTEASSEALTDCDDTWSFHRLISKPSATLDGLRGYWRIVFLTKAYDHGGQPDMGFEILQDDIGRKFAQDVRDEEDEEGNIELVSFQFEVAFEAEQSSISDVDSVEKGGDEHEEENREELKVDFPDQFLLLRSVRNHGRRGIGVVLHLIDGVGDLDVHHLVTGSLVVHSNHSNHFGREERICLTMEMRRCLFVLYEM